MSTGASWVMRRMLLLCYGVSNACELARLWFCSRNLQEFITITSMLLCNLWQCQVPSYRCAGSWRTGFMLHKRLRVHECARASTGYVFSWLVVPGVIRRCAELVSRR